MSETPVPIYLPLFADDVTTLIAALEALSLFNHASEYERLGSLLRRLKAAQECMAD